MRHNSGRGENHFLKTCAHFLIMPRKRKTPKYGLDDAPSSRIDKKKAKVYTVAEAAKMVSFV